MVLLLLMHGALSGSAFVVAVERPSVGVSLAVLVLGNVVWGWCFVTMLTLLGRGR
jgi:hypothetical protein